MGRRTRLSLKSPFSDKWRGCPHCYAAIDSQGGKNFEWSRDKVWRCVVQSKDWEARNKTTVAANGASNHDFGTHTFWLRTLRALDQHKGEFKWPEE